jgi:hypothetical protein
VDAKEEADIVTKGEFAALIGVSPGRVSQYLREGRISPSAVEGEGRNARIRVEQAKADLRTALDVGQRLGNGIGTRLDPSANRPSPERRGFEPPIVSGIDQEIKEQKLEEIRRKNRNAAIADEIAKGTLIKAADARAEMSKMASNILLLVEGSLTDMATGLATKFTLPQRDVLHELRALFRVARANMARHSREAAAKIPETVETTIHAKDTRETDTSVN